MLVCPFICKPFVIIFVCQRIIAIFARIEIVKPMSFIQMRVEFMGFFVLSDKTRIV